MTTEFSQRTTLKKQYVWQCRRGIKEVEVVLNAYLEHFFDDDTDEQVARFGALLKCHDADMFEWFTYRSVPQDEETARYVRELLQRLDSRARTAP